MLPTRQPHLRSSFAWLKESPWQLLKRWLQGTLADRRTSSILPTSAAKPCQTCSLPARCSIATNKSCMSKFDLLWYCENVAKKKRKENVSIYPLFPTYLNLVVVAKAKQGIPSLRLSPASSASVIFATTNANQKLKLEFWPTNVIPTQIYKCVFVSFSKQPTIPRSVRRWRTEHWCSEQSVQLLTLTYWNMYCW